MGMAIFSEMKTDELDDFFLEGGNELMNSEPCNKHDIENINRNLEHTVV